MSTRQPSRPEPRKGAHAVADPEEHAPSAEEELMRQLRQARPPRTSGSARDSEAGDSLTPNLGAQRQAGAAGEGEPEGAEDGRTGDAEDEAAGGGEGREDREGRQDRGGDGGGRSRAHGQGGESGEDGKSGEDGECGERDGRGAGAPGPAPGTGRTGEWRTGA